MYLKGIVPVAIDVIFDHSFQGAGANVRSPQRNGIEKHLF